jgi:hypothetical protein
MHTGNQEPIDSGEFATLYQPLWKDDGPTDLAYLAVGRSRENPSKGKRQETNAGNRTKCILQGQGLGLMSLWKKGNYPFGFKGSK